MIVLQVEFRTDMRNVEGITHTQRVLIRAQPLAPAPAPTTVVNEYTNSDLNKIQKYI